MPARRFLTPDALANQPAPRQFRARPSYPEFLPVSVRMTSMITLGCAAVLLAACKSGDMPSLTGSARPQLDVPKEVSMVSAAEIVGTWSCVELNPYPDQPPVETTLEMRADGTLTSEALLPLGDQMPGAGDVVMTIEADWKVDGDSIVTTGTKASTRPADGADNGLTTIINQVMSAFADRATDGTSEVFKVNATELVMRSDEPDAPTVSCRREL